MVLDIQTHNESAWDTMTQPTCAEVRIDGQLAATITASLDLDTGPNDDPYHVIRLKVTYTAPESAGAAKT